MRKMMFIMLAVVALTATSCSKEARINRKLDGEWKAVTFEDQAVQDGEAYTLSFSKDKSNDGTGILTYSYSSLSYSQSFTYVLAEDKLTTTTTVGGTTMTETVTITTFEKDKIQWKNSDGEITVLQPK